jgi:hypothetical protein
MWSRYLVDDMAFVKLLLAELRPLRSHGGSRMTVRSAISRHFRRKRMRQFVRWFDVSPDTRVLDVGGTMFNWYLSPVQPRLTIVNITPAPAALPPGVEWIVADGRALPFADNSFDICYSNSVIEHLGSRADQLKFAEEVRRVAPRYYVQTPNFWFPIEPHFLAPFIHWMPQSLREVLLPFTPWGLAARPDRDLVRARLREIRLLTAHDLRLLFPDAEIRGERALGVAKSLIALRR